MNLTINYHNKFFKVCHLARSGSHAIIEWIRKNNEDFVYFVQKPHLLNSENERNKIKDCQLDWICRFENTYIEKPVSFWNQFFGRSKYIYDIIILRSPENTLASMIQKNQNLKRQKYNLETFDSIWKKLALLSLNEKKNRVPIWYDAWFQFPIYRQNIAKKLKLKTAWKGLDCVPEYGGGSSFSGTTYDGKGTEMDVLQRWRKFPDHPQMKKIFADTEIQELRKQIDERSLKQCKL